MAVILLRFQCTVYVYEALPFDHFDTPDLKFCRMVLKFRAQIKYIATQNAKHPQYIMQTREETFFRQDLSNALSIIVVASHWQEHHVFSEFGQFDIPAHNGNARSESHSLINWI